MLAPPLTLAASSPVPFAQTLRWTAPGSELAVLGAQPRACRRGDADLAQLAAGEALFNSPALLGGQAAKAGLSCAACHRGGRGNAHFLMPHLSGAPGTADVTSSFFGPRRANGQFDPVAIPDLARPGKVSRAIGDPALARVIRTLVVDEFSGVEPSPAMLEALSAYVRSIGPCAAADDAAVPRRLADQLRLVDLAIAGALANGDDAALHRQLIAAARHQLGLIDERYARPEHAGLRRDLLAASRGLARIGAEGADAADRHRALAKWQAHFAARLAVRLRRAEPGSLYDRDRLSRALSAAR